MRGRTLVVLLAAILAIGMWAVVSAGRYQRTGSLLVRAARVKAPVVTWLAHRQATDVTDTLATLPSRRGTLRARVYAPDVVRTRPLLLLGGVHALGIDEPRLRHFATEIARGGTLVVTPELPDLQSYLVTARLTDDIEDAAIAVARTAVAAQAPGTDARIGLLGVSFSGGLAIVAAGRPALRDHIAFVFSFGGHASFRRVLRYLATGTHPHGDVPAPHDYGAVVLLMNAAPVLVPDAEVAPLRAGVARFLHASHVAMFDQAQAAREFEAAVAIEDTLPDASRHLLHLVNTRNTGELGRLLLPRLATAVVDDALSPEASPVPNAPVFLLHAADDTIIPTRESEALRAHLQSRGTPVRLLTTSLLAHAEVRRRPHAGELVDLVRFWAEMPWEP